MYKHLKNILALLAIILVMVLASCSNKSYKHKYHHAYSSTAPSAYPSSQKSTPIAKKYIVPRKKRTVLGQSGTFRK